MKKRFLSASLLTITVCIVAIPAVAQGRGSGPGPVTAAPEPGFDVASIRQNTRATDGHNSIYNDPRESHLRTINLSLKDLLEYAFDVPKSQIVDGPSWIDHTMFDIDAKSDPATDAVLRALPSGEARHRKQIMTQTLLRDRFQLATHTETRQLPIFALVVAKNGPTFKPSETNGTSINTSRVAGAMQLHVQGSDHTLDLLTRALAQQLGRVVVNSTGLDGRFDLSLRWMPDDRPAAMPSSQTDANVQPGMFTAIQEQLGLKLESRKGAVSVLVVDHVEMPSEN